MSHFVSKLTASLLLAPALLAASVAQAHQAGDIIVRAGAIVVDPREDSSGIKTGGANLGGKATLNKDTQLGLNFAYMLTDQFAVELLAATPFKHEVGVAGSPAGLDALNGKLGTIKHLPPTLSALWYPLQNNSAFQPYVGAGVNFTWFFDEEVGSEAKGKGFRGLSLDNSWGWAAQIGADYMLTENLMVNAQVRYIDISTTGYTHLDGVGRLKVDVDVDPFVYMVGLGYKF
ncbi:OmpW family protein [Halopseudomonas phragmitis]|uniref:Outer membrane protein OmpW n=2 Tax=Pseudomonadaceae TaxID=135621 RepID=A0A1V0B1L3_9GAMM|nr:MULTISPECIES: OmpW family outer membrane protein [Pseudomonadaceae]AQZ93833.1 outer membrane protein OmpW [Halopseudomonas phragmitis]RHW19937.1 outer membrane protein OmpW [Pseudomonas jilinensis]